MTLKKLLFFQFCFHLMNLYIVPAFLPPGSGSAYVHADPDPDPGGISLCGSVRIRIRNTDFFPLNVPKKRM